VQVVETYRVEELDMRSDQTLTLEEWIELGRGNGTIQEIMTVIYAYWMDSPVARAWISQIVNGQVSEHEALAPVRPVMVDGELVAWRGSGRARGTIQRSITGQA
jgi:hypothetical protein